MANQASAKSFEDLIHADRQRKQNERLASQIFGKGKDVQAANRGAPKNNTKVGGSLASRVGVVKRSSSVTSTSSQRNSFNPPSRPSSTTTQFKRNHKIASEIQNTATTNVVSPQPRTTPNGQGLSIKGTAGPFVVEAKNFAPGTTEADIEAAFQAEVIDERGTNCLSSCQIISTKPQVTAELVFSEKHIAERIINNFDNLKADGRILRLRLSRSGPGSLSRTVSQPAPRKPSPEIPMTESNIPGAVADMDMDEMEEVEIDTDLPSAYENEREAADRDRRDRESRRVEPEVRDDYPTSNSGRRGDEQRSTRENSRDDRRRDDRDRDRDRERDRNQDRERERERDGDRDRNYDSRRGDRSFYRGDSRPDGRYPHPNARASHYGNGVGGGGNGGAGGRGFGGFAGGASGPGFRGGYRGAWRGGYR